MLPFTIPQKIPETSFLFVVLNEIPISKYSHLAIITVQCNSQETLFN